MRINLNRRKFILYCSFDAAIQQVASQVPNTFFVAENGSIKDDNIPGIVYPIQDLTVSFRKNSGEVKRSPTSVINLSCMHTIN